MSASSLKKSANLPVQNLGSRVVAKHLLRDPRAGPLKLKKIMSSAQTLEQ
jgi:hypothetical protein